MSAIPKIFLDFGDENCVIATLSSGAINVLPIETDKTSCPSYLYYDSQHETFEIGHSAKVKGTLNSGSCAMRLKRCHIVEESGYTFSTNDGPMSIELIDLIGLFFIGIRNKVNKYIPDDFCDVAIAIPDSFANKEKNVIRLSAQKAGWKNITFVKESTAIIQHYYKGRNKPSQNLFIDIGCSYTKIYLVDYKQNDDGKWKIFTDSVILPLGGSDFDDCVIAWLLESEGATGHKSLYELTYFAEKAKIDLASADVVDIDCPFVQTTLSCTKYKQLILHLLEKIGSNIYSLLNKHCCNREDISRIILTGGSCEHPIVKDYISSSLGKEPYMVPNPSTIVAEGAAMIFADFASNSNKDSSIYEVMYEDYIDFIKCNNALLEKKQWSAILESLKLLHLHPDYELNDYRSNYSTNNILQLYAIPKIVSAPTELNLAKWEKDNIPWSNVGDWEISRIELESLSSDEGTTRSDLMPPFISPFSVLTLDNDEQSVWQALLLYLTDSFVGYRWHGAYKAKKIVFNIDDIINALETAELHLNISSNLTPKVELKENGGTITYYFWSDFGGLYKAKQSYKYLSLYKQIQFDAADIENIYEYHCGIMY